MRNDRHRLGALLIMICVAGGSACLLLYAHRATDLPMLEAGSAIPEVSVTSTRGTSERLRGILRGPCLLLVFSTGCEHCRNMLRDLSAHRALTSTLTRVIGLSLSPSTETQQWAEWQVDHFPVYLLSPEAARRQLGIQMVPTVIFLRDSVIRRTFKGVTMPGPDSLFALSAEEFRASGELR